MAEVSLLLLRLFSPCYCFGGTAVYLNYADSVGFDLVMWMNKLKTFHVLIPVMKMVMSLGG